jgi:hypothetical protein
MNSGNPVERLAAALLIPSELTMVFDNFPFRTDSCAYWTGEFRVDPELLQGGGKLWEREAYLKLRPGAAPGIVQHTSIASGRNAVVKFNNQGA